jgi:hypothetical protein
MESDVAIIDLVRQRFSGCTKPGRFMIHTDCMECDDHDALLRSRDVDTLTLRDVGNVGWDPICYISPKGFAYFFPALARIALTPSTHVHDWYGPLFLLHLTNEGQFSRFFSHFSPLQRETVVLLLRHIGETRQCEIDTENCSADLQTAMNLWAGKEGGPCR